LNKITSLKLKSRLIPNPSSFGGELNSGRRKSKRPLSIKDPIHLVLRTNSTVLFSPYLIKVATCLKFTAHQFNIQVNEVAFNFNHVHLVIKIKSRADYVKFIRALTCRFTFLARKRMACALVKLKKIKIFNLRPFTRIISGNRDRKNIFSYIQKNQNQSGIVRQTGSYNELSLESS
jgi:REP element-mobilizing transposase RayT